MDRVISLLAAMVGLTALGGAVLVHTNGASERHQLAMEIAQLKTAIALLGPPSASPRAAVGTDDGTVEELLALQTRVRALEAVAQAPAWVDAAASPQGAALPVDAAAAAAGDGPTSDCIPLGTRFLATPGDSFAICKTRLVLNVPAIFDGVASIGGIGDVAAGTSTAFGKGCTLALLSADGAGFAEMRLTCP